MKKQLSLCIFISVLGCVFSSGCKFYCCSQMPSYAFTCLPIAFICFHMPSHTSICLYMPSHTSICLYMPSHAFTCIHMHSYAVTFTYMQINSARYSLIDNLINRLNIFPKVILDNRKKMNIHFKHTFRSLLFS